MVLIQIESKICWYRMCLCFVSCTFVCFVYYSYCISITVDGLSIAVRLSRRITTVNSHMKAMLNDFNEGLPVDDRMSWEAACNIHRHSYTASLTNPVDSIPLEVKHEAVKKFQTIVRSNEEMMLLTQEMSNFLEYYENQILQLTNNHQGITQLMNSEQSQDINKLSGCSCLIAKKLSYFLENVRTCKLSFNNIYQVCLYIFTVYSNAEVSFQE